MTVWKTYHCFDCEEPLEIPVQTVPFLFILCEACREKWQGTDALQQGFVGDVDENV